jgi:hypothetical protein
MTRYSAAAYRQVRGLNARLEAAFDGPPLWDKCCGPNGGPQQGGACEPCGAVRNGFVDAMREPANTRSPSAVASHARLPDTCRRLRPQTPRLPDCAPGRPCRGELACPSDGRCHVCQPPAQ